MRRPWPPASRSTPRWPFGFSTRRVPRAPPREGSRTAAGRYQGDGPMTMTRVLHVGMVAAAIAGLLLVGQARLSAQQSGGPPVRIGADDLGGVVTSANGPEAGVWVIAETADLPTRFIKIVVTDDQGGYVLPELPKANYDVWVRGYGLVDSPKMKATPGRALNLTAVVAPSSAAAAEYYPAQYWYSMLQIPDKSLFPGTGPNGNGMPTHIRSQRQWLTSLKTPGCNSCHQVGNKPTRTFPAALGTFDTSYAAWAHRVQVGPAAENMVRTMSELDTPRALRHFAEWTDRIGRGDLPKARPVRPQGLERNVVVTMWDWGDAKTYLHDEIATDKRNPTVNAWGKIYSSTEDSTDMLPVLDPKTHSVSYIKSTPRDPKTPSGAFTMTGNFPRKPSIYWADGMIWNGRTSLH